MSVTLPRIPVILRSPPPVRSPLPLSPLPSALLAQGAAPSSGALRTDFAHFKCQNAIMSLGRFWGAGERAGGRDKGSEVQLAFCAPAGRRVRPSPRLLRGPPAEPQTGRFGPVRYCWRTAQRFQGSGSLRPAPVSLASSIWSSGLAISCWNVCPLPARGIWLRAPTGWPGRCPESPPGASAPGPLLSERPHGAGIGP